MSMSSEGPDATVLYSRTTAGMLERRRVGVFLLFTFGISWATALVIYLSGGLAHSRSLLPGLPIIVAVILIPTFYMFSPAVAHILARLTTREGWSGLYLRPQFRQGWTFWVLGWLSVLALICVGAAAFFVVFLIPSIYPWAPSKSNSRGSRNVQVVLSR